MTQSNSIKFEYRWLGLQDYSSALFQQFRASERARRFPIGEVLFLEHRPVITLGRRAVREADIHFELLPIENGPQIVESERGGEATLHMPGQLVMYPVLPLRQMNLGVRDYIVELLTSVKITLKEFGIESQFNDEAPGLYTAAGKIAFVGVRIDRGVSSHGVSINVFNDPAAFLWIRPCGRDVESMDRIANYVGDMPPERRAEFLTDLSKKIFKNLVDGFLARADGGSLHSDKF